MPSGRGGSRCPCRHSSCPSPLGRPPASWGTAHCPRSPGSLPASCLRNLPPAPLTSWSRWTPGDQTRPWAGQRVSPGAAATLGAGGEEAARQQGHAKSTAAGLLSPSLGHGHHALGRARQHFCSCWIQSLPCGTVQPQPAPAAGTSPKLDKPWEDAVPQKASLPARRGAPCLATGSPPPRTAPDALLARFLATLPLQRPAVPCWEQLDYKRAGPDQGLVLEQSCAGSGSQFFATMVYSTKLPLALREPLWLLTPAPSACRLLFLSSRCFPGSTLLGFNGRKGGFTAPRL